VIHVALQTEKVRDEQEHDMPLLQAISIVFERHPSLKYEPPYTVVLYGKSRNYFLSAGISTYRW
jgi:hypothetical protein